MARGVSLRGWGGAGRTGRIKDDATTRDRRDAAVGEEVDVHAAVREARRLDLAHIPQRLEERLGKLREARGVDVVGRHGQWPLTGPRGRISGTSRAATVSVAIGIAIDLAFRRHRRFVGLNSGVQTAIFFGIWRR